MVAANLGDKGYAYTYDNIGNRESAQEAAKEVTQYESNALNQYTAVGDFTPQFDLAGNQTLIKTATGIWSVSYNAENRPIRFESEDGSTVVQCGYDYMGRRSYKKVTTNGKVTLHQRYIYRGYLQIACCDLTRVNTPLMWYILWDPTQTTATRPLAIQKDGTWYTYGWDLTKNICEIYDSSGYIRTFYTYSPYGAVTADGDVVQPLQWSSEFYDTVLGLVYYNYRYYNFISTWTSKDHVPSYNTYIYTNNAPIYCIDYLGGEVYIPSNNSTIESVSPTNKPNLPIFPKRSKNSTPKSFTYIIGHNAYNNINPRDLVNSLNSDVIANVGTIRDMLWHIDSNLGENECISTLFMIGHGIQGHVMISDGNIPIFRNVEDAINKGKTLSPIMCRKGKLVFFACEAAQSKEILMNFATAINRKVLANSGNVTIGKYNMTNWGITWSFSESVKFPWSKEIILYGYKGDWMLFNKDNEPKPYMPKNTIHSNRNGNLNHKNDLLDF